MHFLKFGDSGEEVSMEWVHPASVLLWNILALRGVSPWSTVILTTYVLSGNDTDCIFLGGGVSTKFILLLM